MIEAVVDDVLQMLRSLHQRSTLHIRPALLQEILQTLKGEWNLH